MAEASFPLSAPGERWQKRHREARAARDKKLRGIWAPPSGTRVVDVFGEEGVVVKEYRNGRVLVQWDNGERDGRRPSTLTVVDEKPPPKAKAQSTPADSEGSTFTDTANNSRLVARHGESIRYVAEDKWWIVWDGSRWKPDALGSVMELAKDTARGIYEEAAAVKGHTKADDELRNTLSKWATTSLSANRLAAMVRLAQTDPAVAISAESLDRHIWLLNCTNGTINLRTGELLSASRVDMITKTTGIKYDPNATCPQWDAFIKWAMLDWVELVEFFHCSLGMSLSGDVSERLVFLLHGIGKNGKSVTLKTVRQITGDYGLRMESSTLEAAAHAKGGGGARGDIARLKGARFVYTSEVEDGTKLAAALLKDLTGDERITARHLYKGEFEFQPELTPWIAANHKPTVPSDDQAVWDRLWLIPFDARIDDRDKDRGLYDKLVSEGPGILASLVRGCLRWQKDGIPKPKEVIEATAEYREEMDTFGQFIEYITGEARVVISFTPSSLRDTYNQWAKDNTDPVAKMTQRQFKAHMEARGWTQEKSGGRRWQPPAKPVHRVNYGEMARAAALHEQTPEEIAAYEAEVATIADEQHDEAVASGYASVEEMYEHQRLNREAGQEDKS